MKISGTRLGMISIIAAICLTGCTKNNDFADNCDLEIAEQVTDIIRASQRGRYDLKNCEVVVTGESKEDGDVVRRMTFLADWRRIREPEDDPFDHKSKGKRQKKGIFHPAISHLTPWYQRFKKYLTGDPRHKR